MQNRNPSPSTGAPHDLDVVLDAALLGVSAVYPSQRAGIWRFVRDWMTELASRQDVRLHLVSSGRAPWNELALEQALHQDPFFAAVRHTWHPRAGLALWRPAQNLLASWAFRNRSRLSPTALAGVLQALQLGLGRLPRVQGVYHSPYHALPGSPRLGPRSLTVHDMIPVLHPEWFDDTTPFQRALASVGPHDHVFADSECTRTDLLRLRGLEPANVHVAYPGISSHFVPLAREASRAQLGRLGLPPVRFLLAVGTLEPRKNLASLLEAFAILAVRPGNADLHLVLTGARGWRNEVFDSALARLGPLRARVLATGFLADADLPVLYGACEAFVFPSLYEGFGLPIAEAMACGAAVACVSNSSQPEVAGDVAVLARDSTPQAIAEAIGGLLSDPQALETRRSRGPAQAGRFTWKACVDRHLEVWREAAGRSP